MQLVRVPVQGRSNCHAASPIQTHRRNDTKTVGVEVRVDGAGFGPVGILGETS